MKDKHSRRIFLRQSLWSGAFMAGGILLGTACGGGKPRTGGSSGKSEGRPAVQENGTNPCDPSVLSEEDLQARKSLGYEEQSPIPDQQCANCNLYLPPAGGNTCGGCTLFKGPVPPGAYCTYWAPQV